MLVFIISCKISAPCNIFADLGSRMVDLFQFPKIWVPLTAEHLLLEL